MNKPYWHSETNCGPWTEERQQDLIEELTYALTYRSLTPEERVWLKEAAE
jgi:hypothetical protein